MSELSVPSRRGFLTSGIAALICSPAIVRASSLMPVRSFVSQEQLYEITEISTGDLTIQQICKETVRIFAQRYSVLPLQYRELSGFSVGDKLTFAPFTSNF